MHKSINQIALLRKHYRAKSNEPDYTSARWQFRNAFSSIYWISISTQRCAKYGMHWRSDGFGHAPLAIHSDEGKYSLPTCLLSFMLVIADTSMYLNNPVNLH